MVTQMVNTDWGEMAIETPPLSLPTGKDIEIKRLVTGNRYADASFQTVRTPLYAVTDARMRSHEDLKVYWQTEANDYIWFCAALQGEITSVYHSRQGETWQSGQANMVTYNAVAGCTCFYKNKPFRMLEIMLSPACMEQLAPSCPEVFDEMLARHTCRQLLKATPDNIHFCPQTGKAIKELLNYEALGNMAPMYLDAKIREILSLFLCRVARGDCRSCSCYSEKDNDLLFHAREIIEREYQHPPSLQDLAHRTGSNECKLKNGFKKLFGATVFGYLFDYRMEMACRYLSDTDRTIQQIAEIVGYEHHSHFSTAFRRKFGVSPVEYRNNRLQGNY
jgi:AraC-like DNA-binding protein